MFSGPIRGGTRGGQGDFKWTDVADDKDRENYLGHSILAPVGRWQKNRDITWYNKDAINNPSLNEDEQAQILRKRKEEEVRLIKMAEEEALSVALGFKPTSKGIGTSSNAITTTLGNSMETEVVDREDAATRRAAEKEEKAARKLARAAKRAARANRESSRGRRRPHSRSPPPPGHRLSSRSPPRYRHTSRSPPRHWDNDGRREKEWRGRKEERVRARSRSMDKDWGRERMARGGPRGRRDEDHPRSRSPPSLPKRQRSPSPQINHSDEERRYRHRHGR